jgi:hypothetical protein
MKNSRKQIGTHYVSGPRTTPGEGDDDQHVWTCMNCRYSIMEITPAFAKAKGTGIPAFYEVDCKSHLVKGILEK